MNFSGINLPHEFTKNLLILVERYIIKMLLGIITKLSNIKALRRKNCLIGYIYL